MKVRALHSFEHGGSIRRHAEFEVSDTTAQALARKGLVKLIGEVVDSRPPEAGTSRRVKLKPEGRE